MKNILAVHFMIFTVIHWEPWWENILVMTYISNMMWVYEALGVLQKILFGI